MKRFFFKLQIAILTFALGLFATWFWLQFSQFTIASISLHNVSLIWRVQHSAANFALPNTKFKDGIMITFEKVETDEDGEHLILRAQNTSREAVYFSGYGLDDPCSFKYQTATGEEHQSNCECGSGLSRQILLSGESTRFKLPFAAENIKVGYTFRVRNNEPAQTFWSEEIHFPKQRNVY